ncbi:hypothetical protein LIER_08485 [Lithospermum erythrorhizon]|uniref:Uncharacterized protein n=1 Tax=Lithospermum erythrorhizon TaxID=34254 RepID=A0AAV3PC95_LITER
MVLPYHANPIKDIGTGGQLLASSASPPLPPPFGPPEEQRPSSLSLPPRVGRGPQIGEAPGEPRTVGLPPPSQIPVDGTLGNSLAPGRPPIGLPRLLGRLLAL